MKRLTPLEPRYRSRPDGQILQRRNYMILDGHLGAWVESRYLI
jgi:hypothetical protein